MFYFTIYGHGGHFAKWPKINITFKLFLAGVFEVMSGLAGGGRAVRSWLTFRLTFLQIRFSHKVFNLRSSNFTHGFFRVSAFM